MRKLLYISLTFLLVTMVMSCGRGVDKRLVLADTLMWKNPDSSLAILNAINRDSLQGDENLAYHALLLTQAEFRVDYAIPSDSAINFAVDYYSDNHNREHYTRALLYKGAFYEVNDNPVEAIKWYKQAEDNADSTDYWNLAQINMRMGRLYYMNYASNNIDLEKFKKALRYYKMLKDDRMIMITLSHIGNLYRESNKSEAIKCLNEAKNIAIEIKDTASYYHQLNELSMAYFLDSLYFEAKDAALECVKSTRPSNAMLFNAVNAYAALGKPDSARHYLAMIDSVAISDYDRMMVAFAKGYIHNAEGNEKLALYYQNLGTAISDSIKANSDRNIIYETENELNDNLKSIKHQNNLKFNLIFTLLFTISIIAAIITFITIVRKNRRFRNLINDLHSNQLYVSELVEETNLAHDQLNKEKQDNNLLRQQNRIQAKNMEFLNHYFSIFNSLLNKCHKIKRTDFIKELEGIIREVSADDNYWDIIIDVADKKTAGYISELKNADGLLNKNEIRILSLVCLGYNNDAISTSTDYTKDSIKTIKTRIRNKIGADINLDAFIKQEILKRKQTKGKIFVKS